MERIGSDVRRELDRFGGSPEGLDALVAAWPGAVGPDISANAGPARLARDGTLVVHARDAVWAFELTLRGEEIRGRLGVQQVRFEVGALPDAPLRQAAGSPPRRVRRATPEQLATAASWASAVEDPELRALVARAASASLARAPSDRSV
jgi:hypothetical protein